MGWLKRYTFYTKKRTGFLIYLMSTELLQTYPKYLKIWWLSLLCSLKKLCLQLITEKMISLIILLQETIQSFFFRRYCQHSPLLWKMLQQKTITAIKLTYLLILEGFFTVGITVNTLKQKLCPT